MSHTVTVKVEYKNKEALAHAVEAMKGRALGEGSHRLFSNTVTGYGFQLPNWRYPVILTADGELSFDNYNGQWGHVKDLDQLKGQYTMSCAYLKAQELGWYAEINSDSVTIFHPSGGTIRVDASGTVDANNFAGTSCSSATEQIESAIGSRVSETLKPEYSQTELTQGELE
jgi:DUF2997 family protein